MNVLPLRDLFSAPVASHLTPRSWNSCYRSALNHSYQVIHRRANQIEERFRIDANPEDQHNQGKQRDDLAPVEVQKVSIFIFGYRAKEKLLEKEKDVYRSQDHAQRRQGSKPGRNQRLAWLSGARRGL